MANDKKIRQGADVNTRQGDNLEAKREAGSVLSSNGVFAKVLKDGKVSVVPTSEVYEKEPDEQIEGIEVQDPTVPLAGGGKVMGASIVDRAQREFNTAERGDSASAHHAQGAAGSIARQDVPEVEQDEGAFDDEEEKRREARQGTSERGKAEQESEDSDDDSEGSENDTSDGQDDTQKASGGFDAGDPEATSIADLEGALAEASDADVKKAQKADSRKGAKAVYEKRLSSE